MVICLQVHVVFTSCYHILQVHVSPRSDVTFGNDVIHRNSTAKNRSKIILHTTDDTAKAKQKECSPIDFWLIMGSTYPTLARKAVFQLLVFLYMGM